jgi:hypothetical protein
MVESRWQRALAVVFAAVFLVTSCTSLQTVNIPAPGNPPALPAVKVGDTVVITTKDAKERRFEVTAIEADALVGKRWRVAYADMESLGVEHIRKGATTTMVVIGIFLVALIASVVALDEEIDDLADPN